MATTKLSTNFTKLQGAHVYVTRALSALPPHRIVGKADLVDIEGRMDHLQAVYRIVNRYADVVLEDTIRHIAGDGNVDWQAVRLALCDAVNEIAFSETAAALHRAGVRFEPASQAEAA